MSEDLNFYEIRDLGGVNPRGETVAAIWDNFQLLKNKVLELEDIIKDKSKNKGAK